MPLSYASPLDYCHLFKLFSCLLCKGEASASMLIILPGLLVFPCAGQRFYAHRIALLASSDAFRAMFDGGYRVRAKG